MLSELFTVDSSTLTFAGFMTGLLAALVFGFIISLSYQHGGKISKSFAVTLAMLPAVVALVILMVSGSIGAGIAVAGAFSLVKFRSAPGTGRDITSIFFAMAAGLAAGMGEALYGLIFTVIICAINLILEHTSFGEHNDDKLEKSLRITIPEDLDYTDVFENILDTYTSKHQLTAVKTANLGSLFKLRYDVTLKSDADEKDMIDELRVRNGNLEISSSIRAFDSDL